MKPETFRRLFGVSDAFEHPVVLGITIFVAAVFVVAVVVTFTLSRRKRIDEKLRKDLVDRLKSWLVFIPLTGAAWTILAVGVLSLLCYREFARATGLFREKLVSAVVAIAIIGVTLATIDHWYGLFVALAPLNICLLAALPILQDSPKGYIQRVGLGVFAFMLFGVGLGHLGYMANDSLYRPIILTLLLCVQMNDVFAYCVGKTLGKRKLAPNTSPNKTVAGSLGAILLTTTLTAVLAHFTFHGTALAGAVHGVALGLLVSVLGQLGDLVLSSIKRDLGIKDMGVTFPGHGGLLDRFNSVLLVAPAAFHYIGYFRGIGVDQQRRIFTGE